MVLNQNEIEFENENREDYIRLRGIKDVLKNCYPDSEHLNKLCWFNEHIKLSSDGKLFRIGDPVYMFEQDLREIIRAEVIYSRKYRICREDLQKLKVNIKKIIEKRLNCYTQVRFPLLDSDDPEEWRKARETRNVEGIWVTAEKKFDGDLIRVCF